jgi:hypothetical protein
MTRDCARFEESIWEAGGDETKLSDEAALHVRDCPACAKAFREAAKITPGLRCQPTPLFPDCRRVVMERISTPRQAVRWPWVWAPVLAAISLGALILLWPHARHIETLKVMVHRPSSPVRVAHKPTVHRKSSHQPQPRLTASKPIVQHHNAVFATRPSPRRPKRIAAERSVRKIVQVPARLVTLKRPLALVMVSWEPPAPKGPAYSEYTERKVEKGMVTNTRVKRTGDSIEIYMDSEPRKSDSTNGGTHNETNSGA